MALGSLGTVFYDIVANDMTGAGITSSRAGLMTLGAAFTGVGMASIAMTRDIQSSFLEFDTAMTEVEAVALSSGAITREEFEAMREAAIDFSTQMPITATDFANAMYLMTSVGYDYNEVMAAMPENAKLAVAGSMSMAEATNAVINVFGAYQEKAGEAEDITRVFANAVAVGKYEMSDFMTEIMKNIGVASQLGISFSDLASYNVALQNAFTSSEEAGTSFNRMLLTMTTTGAPAFKELGISLTDSSGKFRDLNDIMADVKVKLDGVSNEQERLNILNDMFGTYGQRAAIALMSQTETLPELRKVMAEADYMQGQYNTKLESTANRLEIANNKMDAAKLAMAEGMIPATELLADLTGDLAMALKDLPEPLQTIAGLGIYASQGLTGVGSALMFIASFKMAGGAGIFTSISEGLSGLGGSASGIATSAGGMIGGAIIGGIILGLAGTWVLVETGVMDKIGDLGRSLESAAPGIFDSAKITFAPIGVAGAMILDTVKGDFAGMSEDVFNVLRDSLETVISKVNDFKASLSGIGTTSTGGISSLGSAVQDMIGKFAGMGSIGGYASSAFGNIGSAFNSMAGQVKGVFSQMFSSIKGMIDSVAGGFYNAGQNIITSIVNGIVAAAGGIVSAIAGALNQVRALFPFSPAKEGPLAETPNWGTWMSAGMEAAGPEVAAAASTNLAAPVAAAAGPAAAGGGGGSAASGGGDTFNFTVTINGANKVTKEMADEIYREFSNRMASTRKQRGMRT